MIIAQPFFAEGLGIVDHNLHGTLGLEDLAYFGLNLAGVAEVAGNGHKGHIGERHIGIIAAESVDFEARVDQAARNGHT